MDRDINPGDRLAGGPATTGGVLSMTMRIAPSASPVGDDHAGPQLGLAFREFGRIPVDGKRGDVIAADAVAVEKEVPRAPRRPRRPDR
jgi:hypothetical protein